MKVYGLWHIEKKGFYASGYGCEGGAKIVTFYTKALAEDFLVRIKAKPNEYKIKGISIL